MMNGLKAIGLKVANMPRQAKCSSDQQSPSQVAVVVLKPVTWNKPGKPATNEDKRFCKRLQSVFV